MNEQEIHNLENKIRLWVKQEMGDIETSDNKACTFSLYVLSKDPTTSPPVSIRHFKDATKFLNIGISWKLTKEDAQKLEKMNKVIKKKIKDELTKAAYLTNALIGFVPSPDNPNHFIWSKNIYIDGLTLDRFMDVVSQTFGAFEYIKIVLNSYWDIPNSDNKVLT